MATTQNTFTGNGSNLGPFSFTFKWLESTDIKVTVGGVLKTAGTHYNLQSLNYTTKTGGQVLFTAGNAPANGASIRIYRDTDDEALSAVFSSGSAIRAKDLNDNFTQNLYVVQEVSNNAVSIDGSNPMVGDLNMGGYKITNLATPVAGTDATNRSFVEGVFSSEVPVFYRRWSKTAAGGETGLSGNDDNGIALSYVPGSEKVFINGALQVRGVDYSGTTGSTLTGILALTAGDIVEVHSSSSYTVGTVPDGSITNAKVDGGAAIQSTKLAFIQSGSGATTRTVAAKLADVVSVKDFGAVGDGLTNDRNAIAAAVAYINTVGGTLYFPSGTYYSPYLIHTITDNWIEITRSDVRFVGEGNATLQNILFYIHGSAGPEVLVGASGFTRGDYNINTAAAHGLAADDYVQLLSGINSYSTDAGSWQLGSRNPTSNFLSEVRFSELHQVSSVGSTTTASLYTSVIYPDYKDNTVGQADPIPGVTGATIRKISAIRNVAFENLTFECGANAFRNIAIRYAANVLFNNCQFKTTSGEDGRHVITTDCIDINFKKCKSVREPSGASGSSWNSFIIGGGSQNVNFFECYFRKGQQHVDFTNNHLPTDVGADGVSNLTSQNFVVSNCTFVDCSDGFTTHPGTYNLTATGNSFENCRTAIRVRNRRSTIVGNNVSSTRAGFSISAFYEDTLVSGNNIAQTTNTSDEQFVGIQLITLSSEIMNSNDFQNVVIQGNQIRNYGSNASSDGILLDRATAPNPSFTLDTNSERAKISNVVVCDNRLYGCSIRVTAFTNGVCILRNSFEGTSNRNYFIQCEENSARHKIAENFFNSASTDAVLVSNTPDAAFSAVTTTHRVGAALGQLPTVSSLNNVASFYRYSNGTELVDSVKLNNGGTVFAARASGDAQLRLDALPLDGTSDTTVRVFVEGSTATTGSKKFWVYGDIQADGALSIGKTGVTSPSSSDGNVYSGSYTPTITNGTNVASTTAFLSHYSVVGNLVTVQGSISITFSAATTNSALRLSLPIASNFGSSTQARLTGTSYSLGNSDVIAGIANTTNEDVDVRCYPTITGPIVFTYTLIYKVV